MRDAVAAPKERRCCSCCRAAAGAKPSLGGKRLSLGVVSLYGAGFALGVLSDQTGPARALDDGIVTWLPGGTGTLALLPTTTLAAIVVPMGIANARDAGVDPLEPALGATFGAGLGFMLPLSTPCNAIDHGPGYIPSRG